MSDSQLPAPHPHHRLHLALTVVGIAAVLTLAYHLFFAKYYFGIGFAIFMALCVAGTLILATLSEKPTNNWAHLFLIPIVFGTAAELMYASDVVRGFGFVLTWVSFFFFAYWLTAPKRHFNEIPSLWPSEVAYELLDSVTKTPEALKQIKFTPVENLRKIVVGIIIALPFLVLITILFANADDLFRQSLDKLIDIEALRRLLGWELWRDAFFAWCFVGFGWLTLTRALENRSPKEKPQPIAHDTTITNTFLVLLNLLFAVFVAFQFTYFFGGVETSQAHGLNYAQYARKGFFELLWVAGTVFMITWYLYRRNSLAKGIVRVFSLALIAQTGIVILSALKRIMLYVNEYGLTVSRYWAIYVIVLIAAVLAAAAFGSLTKVGYRQLARTLFVVLLIATSGMLLVNVEGFVANYNFDRYQKLSITKSDTRLDLNYLARLSSDATPGLVRAMNELPESYWTSIEKMANPLNDARIAFNYRRSLTTKLQDKLRFLKNDSAIWLYPVLSDYRAISSLSTLNLK